MKKKTFDVRREEEGENLQNFLGSQMLLSRNKSKALIDSRNVTVNRRRVWMARHVLHVGDVVELLTPDIPAERGHSVPVLFEDDSVVIANKPAGLLSNGPASAEAELRTRRNEPDLLAVHRLDRDTSGCLLFARSQAVHDLLVQSFRDHAVTKIYHAIVVGSLMTEDRTLEGEIDGLSAVTHIRTLDANRQASHLVAKIETGRTHQIRRHLADVRHPVLGDRQYGKVPEGHLAVLPERHMLHAFEVAFPHPLTQAPVQAKAPLPGDFLQCLKALRLK
jgi:23S rRNA pseudouridine1911/1915/1917 synthase